MRQPGSRHETIGVLVVDDEIKVRRALRDVIEATTRFEFLGEAPSGERALVSARTLHPDLVLLDVCMDGMDGIETAGQLHAADPGTVIILMSVYEAAELPASLSTCGAADLVRKQDLGSKLLDRIWCTYGATAAR